jgi:hypothetical protein
MKLSGRKANSAISFVDSPTGEVLLCALLAYHLYDRHGELVADVSEPTSYPDGLTIVAADGEVLLYVSSEVGRSVNYRLYNRAGFLTTASDGSRTQIFGSLRMDSA